MRALVKTESSLKLTEHPRPRPGAGEVLVKVMCAGLCRTDLYLARGQLPLESPRVLGHECAGVVCQLGPDVDQDKLGARVAVFPWLACRGCEFCLSEQEKLGYLCPNRRFLGWHRDGCFAEYLSVPVDRCFSLPEKLSFRAGAYLEPLTAALGLLKSPVRQAESVAILGDNRIAQLSSILLTHLAKVEYESLSIAEGPSNKFDLVVETEASEKSLTRALESLRPGGVLVLKSKPAENVLWPLRLQVEKDIKTFAVSYGSLQMAMMVLSNRASLFEHVWREPVPLSQWHGEFEKAWAGDEKSKCFFSPQET